MAYIPIIDFFDSKDLLKRETTKGAILHKVNNIEYSVLGKSKINKKFLFGKWNYLYSLNPDGTLDFSMNILDHLKDSNFPLNSYISNVVEISKDVYSLVYNHPDKYNNPDIGGIFIYNRKKDTLIKLTDSSIIIDLHSYCIKDFSHILAICLVESGSFSIVELYKNKIIWEYNITKHRNELDKYLIRGSSPHINSIKELDDNHLLVSFRNIGIVCINKINQKIEWIIGEKRNDLGFKDIPMLQHNIEFLNDEKTVFGILDNHWPYNGEFIDTIITNRRISVEDVSNIKTNRLIKYNLVDCTSQIFNTDVSSSPREGNVVWLDDIVDINYGSNLYYEKSTNKIFQLGMLEEKNILDNTKYINIKFKYNIYSITRGL